MANKKIKPNRYKPETVSTDRSKPSAPRKKAVVRLFSIVMVMGLMSLGAIWVHDAVVQSPFFTIRTLNISGLDRVSRETVVTRAGLDRTANLFDIRPDLIEKKLETHPWVARARVKRHLFSTLSIRVEEEKPMAIVAIENLADLVINTQGVPFKEYDPEKDGLETLPVITGMDLSLSNNRYLFEGNLFNSVMDLLKVRGLGQIRTIHGDDHTGILIQAPDIYNKNTETKTGTTENSRVLIPIRLGFDRFEEKLDRAGKISRYMADQFPGKTILAMDLYDIEKIFVKTEDALHNTLEKGV